jgi:hypothetical protein
MTPRIRNLGNTWKWVGSYMPGRYILGEMPSTLNKQDADCPQNRSEHFGEERNFIPIWIRKITSWLFRQ